MRTLHNQEYVLTKKDLIISKTDLQGNITYVNNDLVRISGYSREELIDKPHNIFRHPDMPKEVFEGLWRAIKQRVLWTGIVKNKTKYGGFYWVRAEITQIYDEHRKTIGYMSVRRHVDPKDIEKAKKIYADIKAGHSWSFIPFK
ncbi:MAG: PAS domain-containing protein [Methylococcales bacterium]|nr:PAS domain-containing protein [Methylococcales bacterium]